jgi:probable blue pigment (indigoidine) exporter
MECFSPESPLKTSLLTAIAPAAWGSTYYVTAHFLPDGHPLFGAALRALPIGLVLLLVTRRLPRGDWWWKALVLGTLNIGVFFVLIYIAAQRLPTGLAATLTATSPIAMMLLAWPMIRERPRAASLAGAGIGLVGVALLVLRGGVVADGIGVAASVAAVLMASLGFVLVKRWKPPVDMLTVTSWQLVAGGALLLPIAMVVEGAPPALNGRAIGGFAYLVVIATGLAYAMWFRGLQRMEAGTVALIGLLNPVVGTLLGVVLAHEAFGPVQVLGMLLVFVGILSGQASVAAWLGRHPIVRRRERRELCPEA